MKLAIYALALATAASAGSAVESHWNGGRNTPVHKLALNDENGDSIVPSVPGMLPVSTRKTCGQCHDYDKIASGWHFNMSATNCLAGRPTEPWFLIDAESGSQIPMGMRGCSGTFKPRDIGMTDWEYVYAFGRHMPGGDVCDPADINAEGGSRARWSVTGPLEINCFACHSQSAAYDHSEWVRQILRQNFRWAMTGAMGLGDVAGMGSRVGDFWGADRGLNKDDSQFAVPPHMEYDLKQFDSKGRAILPVGKPRSQNCLNCHSVTQVGMDHGEIEGDVHLRAGLSCADCHSNGEDHQIARGTEADAKAKGCTGAFVKQTSCVGCHLGTATEKAGRFGAPRPKHIGIPLSHFSKLTCTACHSGVTRDGGLAQVRTSRANRMGVYGRARWATPQPFIIEPVFVRNGEGKIEPRRMAWPAFWATRDAKDAAKLDPITPDKVKEAIGSDLNVREQLGAVLKTLASDPNIPGKPVACIDGVCFDVNNDGMAVPAEGKAEGTCWFYQGATNRVSVMPEYNADFDIDKAQGTDEQKAAQADANAAAGTVLNNLLQTLDSSISATNRGYFGAAVIGKRLFYRGGEDDAMISTNSPAGVTGPVFGWYDEKTGKYEPVLSDYVLRNAKELGSSECSLTEDMVAQGLKDLQKAGVKDALYVGHGQVWELGTDGKVTAKVEKAAEAVSWAIGHDVRSARLARGAKPVKCADCHTVDSKFLFGKIESTGPLLTKRTLVKAQNDLEGLTESYHKLFGVTFLMRPVFKIFLWTVFGLLCLVMMAFAAAGLPVLLKACDAPREKGCKCAALVNCLSGWAMGLAGTYLGLSGAWGWLTGAMTGYLLVFHMVAGGLFAFALVLLIALRGANRLASKRSFWWMLAMTLAVMVVFTAVAPMMTIFGSDWQLVLLKAHRCVTYCFLAVAAWMLLSHGRAE